MAPGCVFLMKKITALTVQKKNPNRVNVHLDGEFAFGLARIVAAWLLLCAAMVCAIVVVGGITRLTRSGLSIVEWQPLVGTLPPLSESHWEELFARGREAARRGDGDLLRAIVEART